MTGFALKNNLFELNSKIKQEVSGTDIGTRFAPTDAYLLMNKFQTSFLEMHQ